MPRAQGIGRSQARPSPARGTLPFVAENQGKPFYRWAIVLSSLIIGLCYIATQDPVTLKGGKPWDSTTYYYMAEQVRHGATIKASEPFAYRIGLPYLVGLFFENDIFLGFQVFNVFFALIIILIIIKFCERFIESYRIIFTISMLTSSIRTALFGSAGCIQSTRTWLRQCSALSSCTGTTQLRSSR